MDDRIFEVKPSGQIEHALFIAESCGGWDGDGVAGNASGEECAEIEERGGCDQTWLRQHRLHPVGEDGPERAVKRETDDNARRRADESDARRDPEDVHSRCAARRCTRRG